MNIQVSISVPSDLLQRIDNLASTESRSRSNMITLLLGVAMNGHSVDLATLEDNAADTNSPEIDETPAHRHTKETLIAGGLHRCSCGSIRGKDGSWS